MNCCKQHCVCFLCMRLPVFSQNLWAMDAFVSPLLWTLTLIYNGRYLHWMISSLCIMKGSFTSRNLPSPPSLHTVNYYYITLCSLFRLTCRCVFRPAGSDDSGMLQLEHMIAHPYCFDWTIYTVWAYRYIYTHTHPLRLSGLRFCLGAWLSDDSYLESRFDLKATLPLLSCISRDWNIQSKKNARSLAAETPCLTLEAQAVGKWSTWKV